ncbi:MAG: hypothetical protein ACTSSI_00295 [Candidatus Helarchaeota archaeon]
MLSDREIRRIEENIKKWKVLYELHKRNPTRQLLFNFGLKK